MDQLELSKTPEREAELERERQERVRQLASPEADVRAMALKRLGELAASPDFLLQGLDDGDARVRSAAAGAFGGFELAEDRERVIDVLLAAIHDPNDFVCSSAIGSLGRLRAIEAHDEISDCLQEQNPHIVQAAILALGRLNQEGDAELLLRFLDSPLPRLRSTAARAMGAMRYSGAGPHILRSLQRDLALAPGMGARAPLLKAYAIALGELNTVEAAPVLCSMVRDEVGVRSVALSALMQMDIGTVAPSLIDLLDDPSTTLRTTIMDAFLQFDYRQALPFIRGWLTADDATVRRKALEVVLSWSDLASLDMVRELCYRDPNPLLRPRAVSALVQLLGDEAQADLVRLSDDPNLRVRRVVAARFADMENLSEEGRVALQRLAEDPRVSAAVQPAVEKHALLSPQDVGEARAAVPSYLPDELVSRRTALLQLLLQWQSSLSTAVKALTVEEISELDAALTTAIGFLRKAGSEDA